MAINIKVLEDHLETIVKALKEASRLLADEKPSLSARLGDTVSHLNTANQNIFFIHRDGGGVNDLLETLVSCGYRQATVELVELHEGRTAKLDVVKPVVNVALRVATDELILARKAKTPDLPKEEKETKPEDQPGAEMPKTEEKNSVYNNKLKMDFNEFRDSLEKAFYAIRGAYPIHVFDSETAIPYKMYLDNFRYYCMQWGQGFKLDGNKLFSSMTEKSILFDSEEAADLDRIRKELDAGLPTLPRLKQMWVQVVNTRAYQRAYSSKAAPRVLANQINSLIKYEESMQPDTTYWVGEPAASSNNASFLVVTEARRQADKSVDGIGACILRQKSGNTWKLTAAAINKKTNKVVKKTFTVKNSPLYEAVITLVKMARLEVEND